jgi:hypothetical protein
MTNTTAMADPVRDLERYSPMQYSVIEWHLEYNFFPPMDQCLATPCLDAIQHLRDGNPDALITINGSTEINGQPITASLLAEDLHLDDFLRSVRSDSN